MISAPRPPSFYTFNQRHFQDHPGDELASALTHGAITGAAPGIAEGPLDGRVLRACRAAYARIAAEGRLIAVSPAAPWFRARAAVSPPSGVPSDRPGPRGAPLANRPLSAWLCELRPRRWQALAEVLAERFESSVLEMRRRGCDRVNECAILIGVAASNGFPSCRIIRLARGGLRAAHQLDQPANQGESGSHARCPHAVPITRKDPSLGQHAPAPPCRCQPNQPHRLGRRTTPRPGDTGHRHP